MIYGKRREVIDQKKPGWLRIWNHNRDAASKPRIDLTDPATSRIWRFELRLGSKQLRNRWEIRGWDGLEARIGDAFADFCKKVRYCMPSGDGNRSRWPADPVRVIVCEQVGHYFAGNRSFADAGEIATANLAAHLDLLDTQIRGLLTSSAAACGISASEFGKYARGVVGRIVIAAEEEPQVLEERISRAKARYRFR